MDGHASSCVSHLFMMQRIYIKDWGLAIQFEFESEMVHGEGET